MSVSEPLVSVDFEVFGKVQGKCFKYSTIIRNLNLF